MDLYDELMDRERFTLKPDIIHCQEAIWEVYEVKSEKAKNILMGAAHESLRYFMPTLRKRRADLKKCINMYLEVLMSLAESRHEQKAKMRSGLKPLADTSSPSPAASTMVEATATAPNIPHSRTGPIVPDETKPSVPSERVGTDYPTYYHNHSEMTRNDTVCSIAIEPHVSSGPGLEVPGAEDVFHEDVRVEESTQSSTTNTSCEREVVHRTDDLQVCVATPPVNKPKSVESECQDVRLDSKSLVTERGLNVHDVTRKGKRSRPPDGDPSIMKNSNLCYLKVSSSLVRSDTQVTIEPGNSGPWY
jgi:hypothetical protein